ncbi:MAG: hypothetical protein H7240_01065 [Glaciimonas sp.]|nr:hypothetical protein [Glaciimonas sp.]
MHPIAARNAFFRLWVGKEAVLKADDGNVRAFNSVALPFDPAPLRMQSLPVADGYLGAIALVHSFTP